MTETDDEPFCHNSPTEGEVGDGESQTGAVGMAGRPFICTPYAPDKSGAPRPVGRIGQCPWAEGPDKCDMACRGYRARKTGPRFRIQVIRCSSHEHYFTVYPMGYRPFGRKSTAPVDMRGNPVELKDLGSAQSESEQGAKGSSDEVEATRAGAEAEVGAEMGCDRRWEGTVFVAALDAADKDKPLWLHERVRGASEALAPCLRTQRTWVAWAGWLLGLMGDLGARAAEQVACALAVPGLVHQQAREVFRGSRGIRVKAQAILTVLTLVPVDGQTVARLLSAGTIAGVFGPAHMWSSERGRKEFPARRTVGLSQQRGPPEKSHGIGSPTA